MGPRRTLVALALVMGILLAGCGASTTTGGQSVPGHRGAAAAPPAPYPGSSIVGFHAVDLTWVSADQGWALGIAPGCSGQRCATILETTDSGRQWTTVADIHDCLLEAAPVGCPAGVPQVSQIRFANADVGYAYADDGGPYFMTTNGGLSWALQPGRQASAIKLAYGTAVRLSFSQSGCPGPCDWSIDQAPLGQNDWRTLLAPPSTVDHGNVVLLRQGALDIYAAFLGNPAAGAGTQQAQLYVSTDGGGSWEAGGDPCAAGGADLVALNFAAAPGGVVVALCGSRTGARTAEVTVSADSGATFGPLQKLPPPRAGRYSEIAATSSHAIFVAVPDVELLESFDGGQHWRTAVALKASNESGTATPVFLGFETPTVGRWIGPPNTLWTTTNGGQSWIPSGF